MWNAGLDESQDGIKIARKNINNLRYADDTTLAAESEEELKSPLVKVKEDSEKAGLKLNIQKTKITASGPITSWHTDGETMEKVTDFTFFFFLIFLFIFFLFVVNFVIHWNKTAMGLHVFPIPIPPPTSLSTRSP